MYVVYGVDDWLGFYRKCELRFNGVFFFCVFGLL